jgi:hypothetical protein
MYYLQPAILSPPPPLRITKKEFEWLVDARQKLVSGFPIEENFDLLIGNYLELEQTSLFLAASDMVRYRESYQEFFEVRAELNRRAVNLLTAARLYVDQVRQRVFDCGHDKLPIKAALSERYDANFEYRFMDALRNHVQHNGSAVHSLALDGKWVPKGKRERMEYTVTPYTLRQHLAQDKTFKPQVLLECPEKVDFLKASRIYVESLGMVHKLVRETVGPTMKAASTTIKAAISRYKKHTKSHSVGLTAYFSVKGRIEKQVPVFIEWEEVREKLEKRNGTLTNLSKKFVSSVPSQDDA